MHYFTKKQSEVKVSFDSIRKMTSSLEIYFEKLENWQN